MKKILSLAISAILLLTLFACAAETPPEIPAPLGTDAESPTPQETPSSEPPEDTGTESDDPHETLSSEPLDFIDPHGLFSAAGMPVPSEVGGGDIEKFYTPCIDKLYVSSPIWEDIAMYLGLTEREFLDNLYEKYEGNFWSTFDKSSLMETTNLLSIMVVYDIPNEVVLASIMELNDMNENFAVQFGDEDFRDRKFTDAEIEALLSRDAATVLEHFATEKAVVIGDKVYSPVWLYLHTPEDYEKAGITIEMLEEKLNLYGDFNLTAEAAKAFEAKLSEFTGQSVTLEQRQAD
ncbi:MAG: hypothetical protein LBI19_08485 [Oscillospiraceae bacterium]|jgi:hypothetical protein|nr:hypothetical protein [Oscillospiraceae bacterium]